MVPKIDIPSKYKNNKVAFISCIDQENTDYTKLKEKVISES